MKSTLMGFSTPIQNVLKINICSPPCQYFFENPTLREARTKQLYPIKSISYNNTPGNGQVDPKKL